jgi:dTDP-4-amino-4,6-dideoxygalactose transaminase
MSGLEKELWQRLNHFFPWENNIMNVSCTAAALRVPFFRPSITEAEIDEVVACMRSGWLTTGPRCKQFEEGFAAAVGGRFALALNSCTAALHLAVEALGLKTGQAVLVPTMTFAATAEVVCNLQAVPLLVDCDAVSFNMNLADAERKLSDLKRGHTPVNSSLTPVGIIPVHVGGMMMNMDQVKDFARRHHLWIVEDASHAFPAAYRTSAADPWRRCGENTADVSCFSFYPNKTITTGEGGMAVTDEPLLIGHMRRMSLHGLLNHDWNQSLGNRNWSYQILVPGYKYNLTDIAAAIGIHQLRRAEELRQRRQAIAHEYLETLAHIEQLDLPPVSVERVHSWHLFPIRLNLEQLRIDRARFAKLLWERGVECSMHWRPLHQHLYYKETIGWRSEHFPVASAEWMRTISLPLFPDMKPEEQAHVVTTVSRLCEENAIKPKKIDSCAWNAEYVLHESKNEADRSFHS